MDSTVRIRDPQGTPVSESDTTQRGFPPLLSVADTLWRVSALYRFTVPYLRDIPALVQRLGPSGILGGEAVVRAGHPTTPIPLLCLSGAAQ